ncbi:MAG: hypothetical protein ABSG78_16365, partial [Verrucomicrobiota bacterium]
VVIDVDEACSHIFALTDRLAPRPVQIISKNLRPKSDRLLETQAMLRRVAEDLMLCVNVDHAVQKMKEDQGTLRVLRWLTTEVEDEFVLRSLQNAYASRPPKSQVLPGQAFATYLLALSKGPEPVWRDDR